MAIETLQKYVAEFQEQRKLATDEVLNEFMRPRKLEWKGNPNPVPKPPKESKQSKDKEAKGSK